MDNQKPNKVHANSSLLLVRCYTPLPTQVTSTVGHMYSLDFDKEYNDWNRHEPAELCRAPEVRMEDPRPRMTEHLTNEATGVRT